MSNLQAKGWPLAYLTLERRSKKRLSVQYFSYHIAAIIRLNLRHALAKQVYQAFAPVPYTHDTIDVIEMLFHRSFADMHLARQFPVGCARIGDQEFKEFNLSRRKLTERVTTLPSCQYHQTSHTYPKSDAFNLNDSLFEGLR